MCYNVKILHFERRDVMTHEIVLGLVLFALLMGEILGLFVVFGV